MSIKSKLALVAALSTLVAAPAFALDADTAATTVNSGRYVPALNLNTIPAGAYGSAKPERATRAWQPEVQSQGSNVQVDFQATGSH